MSPLPRSFTDDTSSTHTLDGCVKNDKPNSLARFSLGAVDDPKMLLHQLWNPQNPLRRSSSQGSENKSNSSTLDEATESCGAREVE